MDLENSKLTPPASSQYGECFAKQMIPKELSPQSPACNIRKRNYHRTTCQTCRKLLHTPQTLRCSEFLLWEMLFPPYRFLCGYLKMLLINSPMGCWAISFCRWSQFSSNSSSWPPDRSAATPLRRHLWRLWQPVAKGDNCH